MSVSDTTKWFIQPRCATLGKSSGRYSRASCWPQHCRPDIRIRGLQVVLALHRICCPISAQVVCFANVSTQDRFSSINCPSTTIRSPPTTTTTSNTRGMRITPPTLRAVQSTTSDVTALLRFNNLSLSHSPPLIAQLELASSRIEL